MGKNIVSLIARVNSGIARAGTMVDAVIVRVIGLQAQEDRLRRQSTKMSETNLVYFKCPHCDEMSRFDQINKFMQTFGLRFIETDCDTCYETVRLRFRSRIVVPPE